MSFLGSIGKTFVQTFKRPENILVPPLGIAIATTKLAAPLVAHAVAGIKSAVANQAVSSPTPYGQSATSPRGVGVPSYYPQYNVVPSGSFLTYPGASQWDYSTFSPTYPAETIYPPSGMYSAAGPDQGLSQVGSYLQRSLDPFQ